MKKIAARIRQLNSLSTLVLRCGIILSVIMFTVSLVLTYLTDSLPVLNTTLVRCARIYPLLTLMVLAIIIAGALLIDIYDKKYRQ